MLTLVMEFGAAGAAGRALARDARPEPVKLV
jgi:hypothetical protein